jgi:hypothetical protein
MPRIARAILTTEEAFMARILPVAITFAALSLSTTGVRADGTWCAHYGTGLEGMNCGFYSFEQCRATVSGVGGFCKPIYSRQGNRDGVIDAIIRACIQLGGVCRGTEQNQTRNTVL